MKYGISLSLFIYNVIVFAQDLQPFQDNGLWGFKTGTAEVIIQPTFEDTHPGSVACYPVKTAGKWGVIGPKGAMIIPATYDTLSPFTSYTKKPTAKARLNQKWGIIQMDGKVFVDFNYSWIGEYTDNELVCALEEKCGVTDIEGNVIVPFEYNSISLAYASELLMATKDTLAGVVNKANQVVVPFEFSDTWIGDKWIEVYYLNKMGFWSLDGIKLTDAVYDAYDDSFEDILLVQKNEKWGVLNIEFREILPCEYDEIYDLVFALNSDLLILKAGKSGVFDVLSGKVVIQPVYSSIDVDESGFYYLYRDDLVGIFNFETNTILFEPRYTSIEFLGYYFYTIIDGAAAGVMDSDGNIIIQPEYEYFEVSKKKIYGWKGELSTTFDFDGKIIPQ